MKVSGQEFSDFEIPPEWGTSLFHLSQSDLFNYSEACWKDSWVTGRPISLG